VVASTTSTTIVNRALQEISAQATVTGTNPAFDGSAAGNAASILYTPSVQTLLRQTDYEFSRAVETLTPASIAPPLNWGYAFNYPGDCIKIRQILPGTLSTNNDPQPITWDVITTFVSGSQARVICTNIPASTIVYTTNSVSESEWDSLFEETVVRYLASEFVMALGGRPDFSEKMLGVAGALSQGGAGKDS
jgi:hypothetical protein